jgi:hypothetical protein
LFTLGVQVKPDASDVEPELLDPSPKKLEWELSSELRTGIRFAETRLSDLICQARPFIYCVVVDWTNCYVV